MVRRRAPGGVAVVRAERDENAAVRVERRVRALIRLKPLLPRFAHHVPDHAQHRRQQLVPRGLADELVEARVFIRVRLARGDLSLLRREDSPELGELCLGDALGGEGRDRGLDEAAELDHVGERVATRDEPGEWTRQIVRRSLPDEGAAAGAGLDDAQELERPQRFTNGRARDLELFGQLSLGWELIARAKVAFLEETFDLFDDPLIETAATDRLDDGQGLTSPKPLVRWSDQMLGGSLRPPFVGVNSPRERTLGAT